MKLDDMMECSCGVCRHCLRQQLKDLRESYSPKTYADGWRECREAAAGYHEALALICDEKAEDYNIESAKNKDRAGTHRYHAAAIRNLQPEDRDDG